MLNMPFFIINIPFGSSSFFKNELPISNEINFSLSFSFLTISFNKLCLFFSWYWGFISFGLFTRIPKILIYNYKLKKKKYISKMFLKILEKIDS